MANRTVIRSPSRCSQIALRTSPLDIFLSGKPPSGRVPITSIGEGVLNKKLSVIAQNAEGLEKLQQRANERLTRVYPGILRYASDNMSPLLAWRLGFHQVALNSQTCDLPMQARG